jgi:diguanylate cyclase (GGDEF)-like protein/PAS domain S-box-containing protein
MVLPIYKVSQQHHSSLKSLNELYGWVFLTIDSTVFFKQTIGHAKDGFVIYSIFDGKTDDDAHLLYRDGPTSDKNLIKSNYVKYKTIEMTGHQWLIKAQSLPKFDGMLSFHNPNVIGAIGLFTNLAIAGVLLLLFARLKSLDELRDINQQLQFSDNRWRFALEGSGDGVWDWDVPNKQVTFSKRWKAMLGYEERDLENTFEEWQSKIHPDHHHNVMNAIDATLMGQTSHYSVECRFKCKDQSWKWMLARGMVVIKDEHGLPLRMVGTQTDISELKQSEETIWQHANFDALTGLPNRRMFYARLSHELNKTKRTKLKFGLLFLDIDRFKEVNDTLGHDQGDVLLQLAAQRLLACTYEHDVVARLGGDEFVILVSDIEVTNLKNLEIIAQKVMTTLAEPFMLNHEKAFVSASIGIAIYPDDSSNTDDLIKSVDQAMYESKHRGGNCFTYFTTKMQEKAVNRLHLSNDLRSALSNGELFIEYQPIVELKTTKIYKAEALLRWMHPERGLISPAEFIPIAEDTRMINEIGHWVLIESIKQCMDWRKKIDSSFQIAVNKSPIQFVNTDERYSHWVKTLLNETNSVNAIVIEITESVLLDASGHVVDKLKRYREHGIQFALDDFGTGYSSLSYLRKFEIDYLKIDRSFVANIENNIEDKVLCSAIITMAHSLGIKVIAEGIETQEQRDILLQLGCDYGQGFYFSKSLLPLQFEAYVNQL